MQNNTTVLDQFLKLISRAEFNRLAKEHHQGQKFRRFKRMDQFMLLLTLQITGRTSIRDVVSNAKAQITKLKRMGLRVMSRSSFSRINNEQPWELYQALFFKLLSRCQPISGKHSFRFNNKLYSMDASTIDLCLSVFPWAKFRQTKGAVKLHAVLDHDGLIPAFIDITDGKTHDVTQGRCFKLPKGSILTMDRGYIDYAWLKELDNQGVFFVTRCKSNMRYRVLKRHKVVKGSGVTSDQFVVLSSQRGQVYNTRIRRVGYKDPETGKQYYYLTNHFRLSARTIADIYKQRWQIELFFKWIKQNLKIKSFIGTTKNAVLTQIWVALCAFLLIHYFKWANALDQTAQRIIQLLQLNWFERRNIVELFKPPDKKGSDGLNLEMEF
jgi:hypothetical protein